MSLVCFLCFFLHFFFKCYAYIAPVFVICLMRSQILQEIIYKEVGSSSRQYLWNCSQYMLKFSVLIFNEEKRLTVSSQLNCQLTVKLFPGYGTWKTERTSQRDDHSHSHLWAISDSQINPKGMFLDCGKKLEYKDRTSKLHTKSSKASLYPFTSFYLTG